MAQNQEKMELFGEPTPEFHDSVIDILTKPSTNKTELETEQEKVIQTYSNFNPEIIFKRLLELHCAGTAFASAEEFHNDMKTLISSRCRVKNLTILGDTKFEPWFHTLRDLEKKYQVDELNNPLVVQDEKITFLRLCVLFPHYAILHSEHPTIVRSELWFSNIYFFLPEFGGLIPSSPKTLSFTVKNAIITVHLVCLRKQNPLVPGRTNEILLDKRIEGSLLSDERRRYYLEVIGVITKDGKLTWETQAAYRWIKKYITPPPE